MPDGEEIERAREHQRQVGTGGLAKGSGVFPDISFDGGPDFDVMPHLGCPFATPDWRSFNGASGGAKADGVSEGTPCCSGADVSGIESRDSGKDLRLE